MGNHRCSCLLLAIDCMDVSLAVDCVSLVSSTSELDDCWGLLLALLDVGELGADAGNRLSASS